jgi:hypothetical protein
VVKDRQNARGLMIAKHEIIKSFTRKAEGVSYKLHMDNFLSSLHKGVLNC